MDIMQHVREAISNLIHSKLRSLLAMLGIVVGTGAVVALMSSSQLATEHALAQFKTLGTNLLAVSIESNPTSAAQKAQSGELTLADMPTIVAASPQIHLLAPYANYFGEVIYRGKMLPGQVLGVTRTFVQVVHAQIARGRFVSDLDHNEFYGVIGAKLAATIRQQSGASAIGQQLQIGQFIYTVIGVLQPWPSNMFLDADLNQAVMIPLPAALMLNKYTKISSLIIRLQHKPNIAQVQAKLSAVLHNILPAYQAIFRNPQQIIGIMGKQRRTFSLLLVMVGSIALVVGGIGVMNIMLVSVIERKREIGIRMAVGARGRDICMMFLLEAVSLTVIGGIFGVVIGTLVTWGLASISHWSFSIELLPIGLGFGVSTLVGILSGIYPALSAAKLNPIQCLRVD